MELLKSASAAIRRHVPNVALYVGAFVLIYLCDAGASILARMQNPDFLESPTSQQRIVSVILLFVITVATAFVQTIVFSRIGREMDRPLWKVPDDREALRRFFSLWFEFNLIVNTLVWLANTLYGYENLRESSALPLLLALGAAVVLVPFATALMFHGGFSWSTLGEGLGPIGRRLPQLAPAFLLSMAQVGMYLFLSSPAPETNNARMILWLANGAVVHGVIAYLDCLVFAVVWLVCKDDRDSPDEIDLDF